MNSIYYGNRKIEPSKIVCVGRNYVEHIKELGNEISDDMVLFMKPNSSISDELISETNEPIHFEGEISFLYEKGKFSAVGFGLDLTKRELQNKLKAKGLP
jgi:2-keto-4-pentenoate hydratase/2-oxohepta-3-ene-1,7-dioic acid hydratase in catechol pathway